MPNMQKADLQSIVKNNCKHLSANHQKKLLQRLFEFELLSDGTLGDWKSKPVSFFRSVELIIFMWRNYQSLPYPITNQISLLGMTFH